MSEGSGGKFGAGLLGAIIGGVLTVSGNLVQAHFTQEKDKKLVTKALLVEVFALKNAVTLQRDWWANPQKVNPDNKLRPLLPFATEVYDHVSDKINLLDPGVAQQIILFYQHIKFINGYQKLEDTYQEKEDRLEFYCAYDRAIGKHFIEKFGSSQKSKFADFYKANDLQLTEVAPRNPIPDDLSVCQSSP